MDFQFWNLNTATNVFNTAPKASFPSNVSAYFRRPSKVVKPSSRNNSPRTSTRRRMTTTGHAPTRTRSVVDYQRMSMPQLSDARFNNTSRPISWHPNMLENMGQFQTFDQAPSESFITTPYTTAEVNGLVTPMSYPLMDEPQIQELITPLEGLTADEAVGQYSYGQDLDMTHYWLSQPNKDTMTTMNHFDDPSMYHMMNYGTWYDPNQYMVPNIPTAPTSPSYLPMPEFGAPLELSAPEVEEDSEELVAMGLYDSPADVQSSSLLFGGPAPTRKSLKLEDAFEPSPNSEDEEDGEEAEDDDEVNDRPGISPSTVPDQINTTTTDDVSSQYTQVMGNSYMTNQWHAPASNGYGFF